MCESPESGTFNGRPVVVKAFHFQTMISEAVLEELVVIVTLNFDDYYYYYYY